MSGAWELVRLDALLHLERRPVTVETDRTYQEIGIYCFGRGIFHKQARSGLEIGDKALFLLKEGDFILQVTFAWEGAIAIVGPQEGGMYGSTRYPTFRVDESRVVPQFLLHFFETERGREQLVKICPGSAGRNRVLNLNRLGEVIVPVPSLATQRRIVERVAELASKLMEAKNLRQQSSGEASRLLGEHIAEIFSRHKGDSWRPGVLGDYIRDDCYGTSEKTNDDSTGTPILRMGNIQKGRLINHSLKYLHVAHKEREKLILMAGDILVNRTNSAELVGKCAVFDLEGEYGFASYIIRLRLDQTQADPRLIAAYINSPIGRAYMFAEKKQMTGQANVNATTLKKLPIPLPDLRSQRSIVAELDALQANVDAVSALQAETAAELDAMLPAILNKAFKGELV